MVLKQRHFPADKLLLRYVLPAVWRTPLQPLGRVASFWHEEVPKAASAPSQSSTSPAP